MIRRQWLLIVAIAAALVGMYHLVAEHSGHAGRFAHAPMTMAAGVGSSLMSATPTEHSPGGPLAVNPVEASVAVTAVLASHPVGAEWVIHSGDLHHHWTVTVRRDRRSWRYNCFV